MYYYNLKLQCTLLVQNYTDGRYDLIRIAPALARALDFDVFVLTARHDATVGKHLNGSPCTIYFRNSLHLASFSEWFLFSAALAATPGVMPTSTTKDEFSRDVTLMSNAAKALPSPLETKMSAGLVFSLSSPQPQPPSR